MEDTETSPHFRGIFARNALPLRPASGFYIMNFDKKGEPGSRWVSVEIGKKYNTYFDSYGKEPPAFPHLSKILAGEPLRRNRKISGSESFTRWLVRSLCHRWPWTCPWTAAEGHGHVRGRGHGHVRGQPWTCPRTATEGAVDMSADGRGRGHGHVQG